MWGGLAEWRTFYENKQDMTFKKNDLAVFQFMLVLTKCKTGAAAFTLLDAQGKKRTANMCNTEQGVVFDFEDKKAQREHERRRRHSLVVVLVV